MSKSPKLLRVFYKGTEQRIKVFDGTPDSKIIEMIKRVFKITEDSSRIYFQDEDGDILLLPSPIIDGLCVYVYVEPTMIPTPPVAQSSSSLLPGFKWDPTFSTWDGPPIVTNNGYTLGKENQSSGWTPVVSTTEYSKGQIFTKFTFVLTCYQTIGIVPNNVSPNETFAYCRDENLSIFDTHIFFQQQNYDHQVVSGAMYVDFDKRFLEFFWLQDDKIIKRERKNILNY